VSRVYEQRLRQSFDLVLQEASEFFMQRGDLYKTLRDVTRRLDEAGIPYAVIGALALAQHGFVRMTLDIDLLLTKDGLAAFKALCLRRGYVPAFEGAQKTFRAVETGVRIEIITSGEYPGDGLPKPVSFPDPAKSFVDIVGFRRTKEDGEKLGFQVGIMDIIKNFKVSCYPSGRELVEMEMTHGNQGYYR